MITSILIQQFEKDLDRLKLELLAYTEEKDLWILNGEIKNSAGNLGLHLVGNLNHFIGHVLGGTDYRRIRPFEFEGKDVPRNQLIQDIEQTKAIVISSLKQLSTEKLESIFPIQVFDEEYSTARFLVHLSNHLNYHLGQINYHRRILEG